MFNQPTKLKGKPLDRSLTLCVFNKHVPDRNAARWDGQNYVGHCIKCGKRIRRKARNDWKLDWLASR